MILRDDKFRELKSLSERDTNRANVSGTFPKSDPLNSAIQVVLCNPAVIDQAIDQAFERRSDQTHLLLDDINGTITDLTNASAPVRDDLLESGERAPVIQLVNSLLFEAVRSQASDVHIQPREDTVMVRMRIDGILFDTHAVPKSIQEEVLTRIKVLGRMNIAVLLPVCSTWGSNRFWHPVLCLLFWHSDWFAASVRNARPPSSQLRLRSYRSVVRLKSSASIEEPVATNAEAPDTVAASESSSY